MEFIDSVTLLAYLLTILMSFRLFYIAVKCRNENVFIHNIFIVYVYLVPLYTFAAIDYALLGYGITNSISNFIIPNSAELHLNNWVGLIVWTSINSLFLATDGMLLAYIARRLKSDKEKKDADT